MSRRGTGLGAILVLVAGLGNTSDPPGSPETTAAEVRAREIAFAKSMADRDLVALQPTVNYDVQFVGGVKTAFFGGEGLFFTTLTGPGRVWLQSLPLSRLAGRIYRAAPQTGGSRKGEGSILDVVGGLGNMIDGD